jgi:hypothetical protein
VGEPKALAPGVPLSEVSHQLSREKFDDIRRFGCYTIAMGTRRANETKFGQWRELPSGDRIYSLEVAGRRLWKARYFKEVDQNEVALRFWQEIYDETGQLVEVHDKYPVDLGHRKVESNEP